MDIRYIIPKVLRKVLNPPAINNSMLDKTARADIGSVVADSSMGKYSYIGEHTSLISTEVGSFTSISNYCAIGGGSHPMEWVAMSPVFHNAGGLMKKKFATHEYDTTKTTRIGNDVWIGSHCLVKSGVTIADGAVIGMGSVVTQDVGTYEIWAGNPARCIRKRFADEKIDELMQRQWWNWTDEKIEKHAHCFTEIDAFLEETK